MSKDKNCTQLYVYEKSVEIEKETISSLIRSIDNTRSKAGLIFGFFFLVLFQGLNNQLLSFNLLCQIIIFVLLVSIFILLFLAFNSKKVSSNIDVEKNFLKDWSNIGECKFLEYQYEVLSKNKNALQKMLTEISSYIWFSTLLLGILSMIFILNIIMSGDEDKNPMVSTAVEKSEQNPMISTKQENNPISSSSQEFSES